MSDEERFMPHDPRRWRVTITKKDSSSTYRLRCDHCSHSLRLLTVSKKQRLWLVEAGNDCVFTCSQRCARAVKREIQAAHAMQQEGLRAAMEGVC